MSEAPTNPDLPILDDPEAGSTWFISLVSIVLLPVLRQKQCHRHNHRAHHHETQRTTGYGRFN